MTRWWTAHRSGDRVNDGSTYRGDFLVRAGNVLRYGTLADAGTLRPIVAQP